MNIIFLDRDNTINEDPGYLSDPEKVKILPYVVEGLTILKNLNFEFIILTNQSGIGRGYFTEKDMYNVNQKIFEILNAYDIHIKDLFYCPHTDEDECSCRKPKPGLIIKALEKYPEINLESSWIIGDSLRDIKAGESFNIKGILLDSQEPSIKPKNLITNVANLKLASEIIKLYL